MAIQYYNFEQGTTAWYDIRKDRITGTDAFDLLNGKTVGEILYRKNHAPEFSGNKWTERGHILEQEAREIFSEAYGEPIVEVGFVTNDKYPLAGTSPDGLIGEDGGWENKSFEEWRDLEVAENLDAHVLAQIQWNLFITERKYWWLCLYNPDIEDLDKRLIRRKILPDKEIFKKFEEALKTSTEYTPSELPNDQKSVDKILNEIAQITEEIKPLLEKKDMLERNLNGLKAKIKADVENGKLKPGTYVSDVDPRFQTRISTRTTISVSDPEKADPDLLVTRYYASPKVREQYLKLGKDLPEGFSTKTSASVSFKVDGETISLPEPTKKQ